MREFISGLLLIIGFLLQSTLFSQFTIGGIEPNILIILVATVGFLVDSKNGLILGFFAGLLTDIFFGSVIGIYAIIFMYIGYMNGFFKKVLYSKDYKLPIGLIAISDVLFGHLCYVTMFLIKGDFHYTYYLMSVILPEVIYTSVIACLLYPLLHTIYQKIEKYEERIDSTIG